MKTPAHRLFSTLALVALLACASEPEAAPDGTASARDDDTPRQTVAKAKTAAEEPIKYNQVRDPSTGMVQYRSPIPESWRVHELDAPVYISSDRGLKVYKSEQFQFSWSPDPFMQETIRMMGATLAPPVPLPQIVEQQIRPNAEAQGYRFVGSFDAPGVASFWQRFLAAMPTTGNRRSVDVLATEWRKDDSRSMIVLIRTVTESPESLVWQLLTSQMEAPEPHYEAEKSALLYAMANTEINPQWMAASNRALGDSLREIRQYWDNATEVSRQAHQQRMQSIAARGAAARSVGETYSDILDISHQGYLTRDSINDQGHGRLVDSIHGTAVIGNHETGEHYQVEDGSRYYWVNADGLYIGTDNALFDPRLDPVTRDEQWTRFHKE